MQRETLVLLSAHRRHALVARNMTQWKAFGALQMQKTIGSERRTLSLCPESFTRIQAWLEETNRNSNPTFMVLVANKCDLVSQRVVDYDAGASLAQELGILYTETSSKDSVSVEIAFALLAEGMIQTIQNAPPTPIPALPKGKCPLQ